MAKRSNGFGGFGPASTVENPSPPETPPAPQPEMPPGPFLPFGVFTDKDGGQHVCVIHDVEYGICPAGQERQITVFETGSRWMGSALNTMKVPRGEQGTPNTWCVPVFGEV